MNRAQLEQMLKNPDLTPTRRAALEAQLNTGQPVTLSRHSYDARTDPAFESYDAYNDANKQSARYGGENPLLTISQQPAGGLWLRCFTIKLLGGNSKQANQDAVALLPVPSATRSATVRQTVYRALRSVHRDCKDDLTPDLLVHVKNVLVEHADEVAQ